MARGKTNKLYKSFIKGLITEAGPLTYPENASADELNTVIKRKGSRSRRLGIDYEPDAEAFEPFEEGDDDSVTSEYHWKAVANDASLNFLCLQMGATIYFFDTSVEPVTSGVKSFFVDLLTWKSPTASDADVRSTRVQMSAGKGYLFIVSEFIEPLVLQYLPDDDDITQVNVVIQIRDFDGMNDNLANDEEPATLSIEHYYNLRNQGWVATGTGDLGPGGGTPVPPPPPSGGGGYYPPPWENYPF